MSTTIHLKDLTKRFPGSAPGAGGVPTTAVDAVNLTIDKGELFFLLGPSGCGKTTLLRMIAGFIEPTSGQVLFETPTGTRDVTFAPPNTRNTGMVFQSYALWPHMTVGQNVAFGLSVRKVPKDEQARRVREALAMVRMEQYETRRPTQLSGGQQQRVALARALVVRPDVLLLDEPLSNLDAKLRIELRSEIRRICKLPLPGQSGGMTAIYVTHDQKEALSMADRVAIVSQGKIVQVGPPAELYRRPHSKFVAEFLGETNFIEGSVLEHSAAGALRVHTAAGVLMSTALAPLAPTAAGSKVVLSIRPEAWRMGADAERSAGASGNLLHGVVSESTYLGETAQLIVDVPGPTRLTASVLNPGGSARPGDRVSLAADPADVVALPA